MHSFLRPFYMYGETSGTADDPVESDLSAAPGAGPARYVVEVATGPDGEAMHALRDVHTDRIVKHYRSRAVALNDARFLNVLRPPMPLG